jgi:hypothetical protein
VAGPGGTQPLQVGYVEISTDFTVLGAGFVIKWTGTKWKNSALRGAFSNLKLRLLIRNGAELT